MSTEKRRESKINEDLRGGLLQVPRFTITFAIHHFHIDHNTLCLQPKI